MPRFPRPTRFASGGAVNAREQILARARRALSDAPATPVIPRDYHHGAAPQTLELVERFAQRVSDYRARVHYAEPGALAGTVGQVLAGTVTLAVPADLPEDWFAGYAGTVQPDPPVVQLDQPGVSVLTGCAVAVAETGTIVLDAGPGQGRRVLTLVPDHHVCVVRVDQIAAGVPQALQRLADPTRPLTFISGPSATSDIELRRVEGVHGPRRLDVVITAARCGPPVAASP